MKIGIDPGNTGAIAILTSDNKLIDVNDMPTLQLGKKKQINPVGLANILHEYKNTADIEQWGIVAYVERVQSMPGQGVASMFNFGMGYGVIQGVVAALGIPMVLVTPQSWKRRYALIGKDKDNARTLAQQLYPKASLARKKDIGRADAILIARYGDY